MYSLFYTKLFIFLAKYKQEQYLINIGRKFMRVLFLSFFLIAGLSTSTMASSIRFSDLDSKEFNHILSGQSNQVVEFQKGDLIPLGLKVEGDLLSLSSHKTNFLKVQKKFFILISRLEFKISFDGHYYLPLSEALTGSLTVDANVNSPSSLLNILLDIEQQQ